MIKDALDLQHIISVFDQALYAKATEIKWKHQDKFSSIENGRISCICNFLGIICKRFKDAGLRDLGVETGIIAEGSIDSVLDGHKYK